MFTYFSRSRFLLVLVLASSFCMLGCALTGSSNDGSKGTSRKARNSDTLILRNGDAWRGTLALDAINLATRYAGDIRLERKDLDRIEFLATGDMKIRTKPGDTLQGKVPSKELRFKSKIGEELVVQVDQIREILFK